MKTYLKNFLKSLWNIRKNIILLWMFFYVLAIYGTTPHTKLELLLYSGLFSVFCCTAIILYIRLTIKK